MSALDRLDAIDARANAATEGPWTTLDLSDRGEFDSDNQRGWWWVWQQSRLPNYGGVLNTQDMGEPHGAIGEAQITDNRDGDQEHADAEFIASARQDVPALVAALRAVLDLHREGGREGDFVGAGYCIECSDERDAYWPCRTVEAIESALGGAE